jgi:hypothetical protein
MGQDLPVPDDDFTPSEKLNSIRMPASEASATQQKKPSASESFIDESDSPKHRGNPDL